ncbi:putative Transcription factor domain-containing protein [Seiridium cardinale]
MSTSCRHTNLAATAPVSTHFPAPEFSMPEFWSETSPHHAPGNSLSRLTAVSDPMSALSWSDSMAVTDLESAITWPSSPEKAPEEFVLARDYRDRRNHWGAVVYQLAQKSQAACVCSGDSEDTPIGQRIAEVQEKNAHLLGARRKALRERSLRLPEPFLPQLPARARCNELVDLYLGSLEKVLRVFHVPHFEAQYQQYWAFPDIPESREFLSPLSLVLSIGASLHAEFRDPHSNLRTFAFNSISRVQARCGMALEGPKVTLATLQTYCLLFIARQTNNFEPESIWLTIDILTRLAMQLNLHRQQLDTDATSSPAETQLRRKLWVTVIELSIQSSMDHALPPFLRPEDLQLELPLNVNDEEFKENEALPADHGNSPSQATDASIQILLGMSTQLRLRVIQHLYGADPHHSFETTLELSESLEEQSRATLQAMQTLLTQSSQNTIHNNRHAVNFFHASLVDSMVLGTLMALHIPYALRASDHKKFYFSRKICFEAAWKLMSRPSSTHDQTSGHLAREMLSRLRLNAGGFFQRVYSQTTAILCLELVVSLSEDSFLASSLFRRVAVLDVIQNNIDILARCIEAGSLEVGMHVIFSCALEHVKPSERDLKSRVAEAARISLSTCHEILRRTAGKDEWLDFSSLDQRLAQGDCSTFELPGSFSHFLERP